MTSKLFPARKHSPCPICDDESGKCRLHSNDEIVLCMSYADAAKFEIIGEYKCIKPSNQSKNGDWATFIHTSRDTYKNNTTVNPDLVRERAERKAQNALQEIKSRQWIQENSLSIEDRHKLYSQLFNELILDSDSLEDLRGRGFSDEEIQKSGLKSYQYGQKLKGDYPESLPGIKDGNRLNCGDGTIIPCKDFDGRIAGFQVRSHKKTSDGNRYRWGSNGNGLLRLQPENENPLAVYHPDALPVGIAIVEGTGAKPFFVAQRLGYLVVGAAGGLWLSSEKLLKKYINQAFDKYGDLPITIFPDAGFGLNQKVSDKIKKLVEWLQANLPVNPDEVLVADWNQITKKAGDIDEISDLSRVRYLKASSFFKKYKQVFENGKRFKNWAETRTKLTVDIPKNDKWLSIPKNIQEECDILLISAGLGKGKTHGSLGYLKEQNVVAIWEGYRNSLINQTVKRSNETGVPAIHIQNSSESIKGHGSIDHTLDESIKLFAGCADSFHKLEKVKERNPDYYLIIDEICSVLNHLKGGGTLKSRRKQAIKWTEDAIAQSSFCLMMDANLSDNEVNFIKELFPEKKIKVLQNLSDIAPRDFFFVETKDDKIGSDYTTNRKYLPSHLIEMAKECKKFLWISDSQRSCEVSEKIIAELLLKRLRIDGKTSQDEISKQFLENPKLFIESEQLESLHISPSGESGLSIDVYDYFDAVFFDVRGTVGVNTLLQMSDRLRDTKVPVYVSCPDFVNMTKNECPYPHKVIQKIIEERSDLISSMVLRADPSAIDSTFIAEMFNEISRDASKDIWSIEALKDSAKLVHEHQNLKLYLKTALQQAGNKIYDLVVEKNEKIHEETKDTKEEVMMLQAKKIYESVDLTKEQKEKYEKQENNYDIQCALKKAQLKERLPGIENTKSWTVEFLYTVLLKETEFLSKFWDFQKLKNENLLNSEIKNQTKGKIEYGQTVLDIWKNKANKIEGLKLLGFLDVINAESFSTKQENIIKMVEEYYNNESYFNLIGISKAAISEKHPNRHIKIMLNRFLDVFGLETEEVVKNNSERHYRICVPLDIKPYLVDIQDCYSVKAKKIIDEAKELNLKEFAEQKVFITESSTEAPVKDDNKPYFAGQYVEVIHEEGRKLAKVVEKSNGTEQFFCKVCYMEKPLVGVEETFISPEFIKYSECNELFAINVSQ